MHLRARHHVPGAKPGFRTASLTIVAHLLVALGLTLVVACPAAVSWAGVTRSAGSTIAFLPHADYVTGSLPISVAVGDLNGDGKPDLAIANDGSNAVSIFLGDGAGGFAPRTDIAADDGPHSVAIGDLNGDGKLDLAVANYRSSTVSVLLGDGTGNFGPAAPFTTGSNPYSVAIADLDGDGKRDLALASYGSNAVSILLGDGAGGFGPRHDFATGANPACVAVGDLNGDGKPDLAVSNEISGTVSVLLGSGTGSFGPKSDFAVGSGPWSVAIGDLNGDSAPDLAVTNFSSNTVSVLLGNGSGVFGSRVDLAAGPAPRALAVGDLDADGKLDLVVPNDGGGTVSVFLNDGAGGFGAKMDFTTGANPYSVAMGDFNNDGAQDLAVPNLGANTVSVLLQVNPGAPTATVLMSAPNPSVFGEPVLLSATVSPSSMTGSVAFMDGTASLGAASLAAGVATLSVSGLSAGSHSLTARYGGSPGFGMSTSPIITQVVHAAATTTTLHSNANPSAIREPVTFTAIVSAVAPGAGHPTGTMKFKVDNIDLGAPVPIGAGDSASVSTDQLSVGDHAVQAIYMGDGNFNTSSSPALTQTVTSPSPTIVAVRDAPHDQGGHVFLTWRSPLDKPGVKVVTGYRVWRRAPNPGTAASMRSADGARGSEPEGRMLEVVRTVRPDGTMDESFWEAIATLPSEQLVSYAYEAATAQDSIAGSNPFTAFFITALTSDSFVFFQSAADSGYSVDNLAPPMPAPFIATYRLSSTELHWGVSTAPDFGEFRLYRGLDPEFDPGPANLVIATRDTGYVDPAHTPYVYKLEAVDLHGNPSRSAVVTPNGPVATLASLVSVEGKADRIALSWFAASGAGLMATLYRRTAGTEWAPVCPLSADGTGYLRFEDTAVLLGTRYGYRLGIVDGGVEVFVGEAWAVAEPLSLALDGARPNPTPAGDLRIYFTLPNADPARLDLIDVTGRQLVTREVGSLGPGTHSVEFGHVGRMPAGVYFIRLTRDRESTIRRVALLP